VRAHEPPITALDLDPGAQSRAAVDMLLALIAGDEPDAPRLVPAELRVRASTLG
jgi:DNA-binding LacI/PurR family transcriptional regulator